MSVLAKLVWAAGTGSALDYRCCECLNRMIFIGEASLRRAVREFMAHYHAERNYQGLGNQLISADQPSVPAFGPVERRIRLGGMLSFYHHAAA